MAGLGPGNTGGGVHAIRPIRGLEDLVRRVVVEDTQVVYIAIRHLGRVKAHGNPGGVEGRVGGDIHCRGDLAGQSAQQGAGDQGLERDRAGYIADAGYIHRDRAIGRCGCAGVGLLPIQRTIAITVGIARVGAQAELAVIGQPVRVGILPARVAGKLLEFEVGRSQNRSTHWVLR